MKTEMRFVGLDVHKRVIQACIVDEHGKEVLQHRFDLTKETLRGFASETLRPTDRVVLEATTNSWSVVRILKEVIPHVVVSNPVQTRAIASAKLKTDKVDAAMLAQLLRCDFLPLVWQPDEATQDLRAITTRRTALVQDRTAVKNRLQSALQLRLEQVPSTIKNLFTKRGLAWLQGIVPDLHPVARLAIESDLRLYERLGEEIAGLDVELYRRGSSDARLRLLMTLPGVDIIVGQAMLAAIGDVSRFRSADQAASYFGLTPRVRQSASKAHYGAISKAGRSHSRGLMIQAAWAATCAPGPLAAFYKKLHKKKSHGVAVVAVARKLVTYAWHMLTNNEAYRYAAPGNTATKLSRLRIVGSGEKRRSPKGKVTREVWKDGEVITPSLGQVYESENLPPHQGFDALPEGEQKMLRKKKLVRQVRAIEKIQRVSRSPRKAQQKPAAKGGKRNSAARA